MPYQDWALWGIASIWDWGFQISDLLKDYFQIYIEKKK